jgi:cell division protein FtsL
LNQRPFLAVWTLAVVATATAFVVDLGLRGRSVDYGYRLGAARAEQARLREVKRVLSLEAASYETPQRVEQVARTLLGMTPPPPERVFAVQAYATQAQNGTNGDDATRASAGTAREAGAGTDGEEPQ